MPKCVYFNEAGYYNWYCVYICNVVSNIMTFKLSIFSMHLNRINLHTFVEHRVNWFYGLEAHSSAARSYQRLYNKK